VKWKIALALLAGIAAHLPAQQVETPTGRCRLLFFPRDSTKPPHTTSIRQPSGQYNSFIGGGVIARCPAQSMTLISDSAEFYGDQQLWHLIGHVHYTEPRLTLDSDLANYFVTEERLEAEGNVHTLLPSGTTLDGPRVEYYRAAPNVRPVASMTAPGRPTIKIVQRDSTGKPSEPMTVIANTVTMRGDSLVYASGNVDITRPDVLAKGDSAALDSQREFARLMRKPSITARGDRSFVLTGTVIDLFGRNRAVERVLSQGAAKGVSQDATLTADTLDFKMAEGRLQRVYAWGKSRAHATNPTYDIVADSLDVHMPDQRMREIRALRQAFAQSVPDTTKVHTTEHNWLRGDTIYAYFDSTPPAPTDTASQPALRQLLAVGNASSFYQIAAKDTAAIGPAINYVRGERIIVALSGRQLDDVTIVGQAEGVYLDPTPAAAAAADSVRRNGSRPPPTRPPASSTRPRGRAP
jgi:lipopolysaccharide export system protein LptA